MSPFEQVVEFNANILGLAQRPLTYPIGSEMDHSLKCLTEERDELSAAFQGGDFIGCVDANIDIIYFAIGNLYKMGLTAGQMEEIFTIVHNKNMTKTPGVVASRATVGAVDAVKPADWVGPEAEIGAVLDQVPAAKFTSAVGEGTGSEEALPPDNPENDPATQQAKAAATKATESDESQQ